MDADTRSHEKAHVVVTEIQSEPKATSVTASIDHTPDLAMSDQKTTMVTSSIDHTAYPHIVDMIFNNTDSVTRWTVSQTCRSLRKRFHEDIGGHIGVVYLKRLVGIRAYRAVPTIPHLDDTDGAHSSTCDARECSLAAPDTPPREEGSAPLHTCDDFFVPYEDQNTLTRAELDWFTKANIAVVDIDDRADMLPRMGLDKILKLLNPKILRCPTLYPEHSQSKHVSTCRTPYTVVHPTRMMRWGSPNIVLASPRPSVAVQRTVFALHYDVIPATRYPGGLDAPPHLVDSTIHISASPKVDYDNVSASDKHRNLVLFRNFLHNIRKWVKGDVTIVGLERVAGSLFGQPTPCVIQLVGGCVSLDKSQLETSSSADNEPHHGLQFLTEAEYVELHDMSPLRLAIERGVGYRWAP